eukprot:TRINITY_DN50609_c0_g1_i2.p1 TRINITY_DN50609_c0_g1~~TRINITY_DN50609_c0_g1_i2.p1  ORF type:complete len:332 (+),score=23.31 TRINITY_DN50609_c0_g1_i2:142-1137(+)
MCIRDSINAEYMGRSTCTFQPSLRENVYNERADMNREDRMYQLSKPTTEEYERKVKQKQEEEERQFSKECTFHPKINPQANLNLYGPEEDVEERLYNQALRRLHDKEKIAEEQQTRQLNECTFKPNILDTSLAQGFRPLQERFKEVQQLHRDKLQRLQAEAEANNPHLTFHPQINAQSPQKEKQKIQQRDQTRMLRKESRDFINKQNSIHTWYLNNTHLHPLYIHPQKICRMTSLLDSWNLNERKLKPGRTPNLRKKTAHSNRRWTIQARRLSRQIQGADASRKQKKLVDLHSVTRKSRLIQRKKLRSIPFTPKLMNIPKDQENKIRHLLS